MRFNISIEETVVGNFEIEANSKAEAFEVAKCKYYNCEFVNEPGEIIEKRISIGNNDECHAMWESF